MALQVYRSKKKSRGASATWTSIAMANKTKIKILFLHQTLRQGGTSRQLLYLLEGLDRKHFDPILVIFEKDKIFYQEVLTRYQVWILREHDESYVRCLAKFIKIIKREQPDAIQTFNPSMTHFICISSLFFSMPPLLIGIRNRNLSLKKIVFNLLFSHRFRKIIVNSSEIKRELSSRTRIKSDNIHIIYNTIDTNLFSPMPRDAITSLRRQFNIAPDDFLVLSIGRIHKQKNIMCTLKALATLKDRVQGKTIKLIHVGLRQDKKLYAKLLRFVASHGMSDRCVFMEPALDVETFYNMADVTVLSSLWEGLPNVILEAMACEGLIIASESADRDQLIDDGVTGYKFRCNDAHALASVFMQVLALDVEARRRIGISARREVLRRFTSGLMVREFQSIYSTLS